MIRLNNALMNNVSCIKWCVVGWYACLCSFAYSNILYDCMFVYYSMQGNMIDKITIHSATHFICQCTSDFTSTLLSDVQGNIISHQIVIYLFGNAK